jgi:HTH-type transcriptional regulator/antitoxin HigA
MKLKPIRIEAEYELALREVSAYFENEPTPGTVEGDRFEILVMPVEAYEARHHPIAPPDPVEAQYGKMPD